MMMKREQFGFSLIELLVVFMIIALVMSVVAPSVNKMHAQHMAQQEIRLLQQFIKQASTQAYTEHQDIHIQLKGFGFRIQTKQNVEREAQESVDDDSSLISDTEDSQSKNTLARYTHDFEYLFFPAQFIKAYKSGHINSREVEVRVGSAGIEKYVSVRGVAYIE